MSFIYPHSETAKSIVAAFGSSTSASPRRGVSISSTSSGEAGETCEFKGEGSISASRDEEQTVGAPLNFVDDARHLLFETRAPAPYSFGPTTTAGPSASTAPVRHTADLGPTLIPNATGANGNLLDVDMVDMVGEVEDEGEVSDGGIEEGMPDWRRGIEDNSGGDRVYTEAETLSFFDEAAAGYDFDEKGEAALEEGMVTIGLDIQGDIIEG